MSTANRIRISHPRVRGADNTLILCCSCNIDLQVRHSACHADMRDPSHPKNMEGVVNHDLRPRITNPCREAGTPLHPHEPLHEMCSVQRIVLRGDQHQLPPRHAAPQERHHVRRDMDSAPEGRMLLVERHPVVLDYVVADQMRVYPVHSSLSFVWFM